MQQQPGRPFTILVVEDEALIRAALRQVLKSSGFIVCEADCVAHAVGHFVSNGQEIDGVFCDIQMPGAMDGLALADWIRDKYPHAAVMLTSGYPARPGALKHPFLAKPYDFDAVVKNLHALLHARTG